jgi:hypothetical protein
MIDEHTNKVIRLLDLMYDLYGDDAHYPCENQPFLVDNTGRVVLHELLLEELNKDENKDLIDWAHENIVSLFK